MKVYSFTTFFNERDLFALRMAEEGTCVDKMVVVEADVTYSGWPKGFNFDQDRWQSDKVDYYKVKGSSCFRDNFMPMDRDRAQKNYGQAKYAFEDKDVILITDCDEVLHKESVPKLIDLTLKHGFVTFGMPCYYYFINTYRGGGTDGGCAIRGDLARKHRFMDFRYRKLRKSGDPAVPNPTNIDTVAGNHFSYLSNPKGISDKLKAFAHIEFSGPQFSDPTIIKGRMERLEDPIDRRGKDNKPLKLKLVPIDGAHPKTIRDNLEFWKKYMYEVGA